MSKKRRAQPSRPEPPPEEAERPRPVDVVDGIPDRCRQASRWQYVAIGAVFLAWVAFLIYCAAAGRP
ncbi:MAG TPA: hypothetical protein VM031_06540 [Phycisphaerae bacterium]|nr:hypothetical protein [Phycisphaerae bacterium]